VRVLLFTQCLQNDFTAPIPPGAPLPNALHVGRSESRRLLGDPDGDWEREGPLARFLADWRAGAGSTHASIHIRDWHDPRDPATRSHLDHFGEHCLRGTPGARFVSPLQALVDGGGGAHVVDSAILSDFVGTDLEPALRRLIGEDGGVRAGIVGVWTDVKVHYLAYDLMTRLGLTEVAVCSALTASRSRIQHRQALEQMAASLGVRVVDSVPEFLAWLGVRGGAVAPAAIRRAAPEVRTPPGPDPARGLGDEERRLVEFLFRDCREVTLTPLAGGFSGSRVFRSASVDRRGLDEIPFVVKIDDHRRIARERVAVESVENLLGAVSPRLADYVDLASLGAIKYYFATMHGGEVRTLQKAFRSAAGPGAVRELFDNVIGRVLRRLYQRPTLDRLQLFEYYDYRPEYAERTLSRVSALAAREDGDRLEIAGLPEALPHPRRFYESLLARRGEEASEVACAWVHGDLNLANVLLDDSGNAWLIDYFWTRVGHALQDVAKLENDLKFITVPLPDEAALARALAWERLLLGQTDLAAPPPDLPEALAAAPGIAKAHAAIQALRELAASLLADAGVAAPAPAREYRIAQLRYSAHTLSFDECDERRKRFALASTCLLADALADS
jgi:nicotinamidase-related amidase